MAKTKKLINIYALHYFHGEYNFIKDIKAYSKMAGAFYPYEELDGDSWEKAAIFFKEGIDMEIEWAKFLKQNYPTIPESFYDNPATIIGIQFMQGEPKKEFINLLYNLAIKYMDEAGGDDSFFDYCPDTVQAINQFLIQLGAKAKADKLDKELIKRGHYD
jgi:hypothetical protein